MSEGRVGKLAYAMQDSFGYTLDIPICPTYSLKLKLVPEKSFSYSCKNRNEKEVDNK